METNLNKAQIQAVKYTDGPMLILAGAGSGKTRVLTHKVAYLIQEKKYLPSQILMLTFTNKAAGEMKKRISRLLGNKSDIPFAGTFHSLCVKILKKFGQSGGIPSNFVIYDSQDQKEAIKIALEEANVSSKQYSPQSILALISQAKNELISPDDYQKLARGQFQEIAAKIYPLYQKILKKHIALDFDDLLNETIHLLRTYPHILDELQHQFLYILVDEYQDTNTAQYVLTRKLSEKNLSICVVGDASQSIYSFRGANFRNINRFINDHPTLKIFHLEENYRSTQRILTAANSVISKNTSHPILKLWTSNPIGDTLTIYEAQNEQDEALFIISEIAKLKLTLTDVAIVYRTNAQSRAIEEVLLHEGLPYTIIGGVRFYERKEIKDIISFLKLIQNPHDAVAKKRIEKVGKRRAHAFYTWRDKANKSSVTLELIEGVLKSTHYSDLYNEKNPEDESRIENIKELRSVASRFPSLSDFLENVALVENEYTSTNSDENSQKLTLLTLHAAKGLEFEVVFITGMEEGLFPHSRSLFNLEEMEEERRLCYVGITRAKRMVFLSFTKSRFYFGQRAHNQMSRFITDLPEELLDWQTNSKNNQSAYLYTDDTTTWD